VPVFALGSIVLAGGFVYENRRLLRPAAARGGNPTGRLLARYGPTATALFLAFAAFSAEMITYGFFYFFHPK
jgi:hypothetical protein